MELHVDDHAVTIRLTPAEALRIGVALNAGCSTIRRAEYFIRTGLSQPEVREIAQALARANAGSPESQTLPLTAGLEEVENPRRPRPQRDTPPDRAQA